MTTVLRIQLRGKWKVSSSRLLACQLKMMQIFKVHICFCSGRALKSPCPAYLLNSAVEPVAMCTLWSSHPVQKWPFCQTLWLLFETRFVKCWSINSNLKRQTFYKDTQIRRGNIFLGITLENEVPRPSLDFSEATDKCLVLKAIHPEFQELTQWDFKSKYSELRKNTPLRPSSVKS